MNDSPQQLTRAEEEVMQILWEHGEMFVKEVVEQFPDPKPAYNTVSTIIRILEKKEFVSHNSFGRTHQYFPLIGKDEYLKYSTGNLVEKYFSGSYEGLLSFFVKQEQLDVAELEKLLDKLNRKEEES